jgi:hypothetical protein
MLKMLVVAMAIGILFSLFNRWRKPRPPRYNVYLLEDDDLNSGSAIVRKHICRDVLANDAEHAKLVAQNIDSLAVSTPPEWLLAKDAKTDDPSKTVGSRVYVGNLPPRMKLWNIYRVEGDGARHQFVVQIETNSEKELEAALERLKGKERMDLVVKDAKKDDWF